MSEEETITAFGPLDTRAASLAGAAPLDRISLRDYMVEVEIGAFQAERGVSQRIKFDVVVEVRPTSGPVDDDVDRILSYDTITEAIDDELAAERVNLLETLAERVSQKILSESQAQRVFVRIEKLDRGPGALGVEIVRSKGDAPGHVDLSKEEGLPPVVLNLSNAAIGSPKLPGWIDQLERSGSPAVFCVGQAAGAVPEAGSGLAQRHIDLLGLDQNAWRLAGQDRRLIVAGSRTELDWAVRHRKLAVWAPSKMVLDAVGNAPEDTRDVPELIGWLIGSVGAVRLFCIDTDPPTGATVEVSIVSADQAALF